MTPCKEESNDGAMISISPFVTLLSHFQQNYLRLKGTHLLVFAHIILSILKDTIQYIPNLYSFHSFTKSDRNFLLQKIAVALYGPPTIEGNLGTDSKSKSKSDDSKKKQKKGKSMWHIHKKSYFLCQRVNNTSNVCTFLQIKMINLIFVTA